MKVSSLHKSVFGLVALLQVASALEAVQIWLSGTCQGKDHSWIVVDNGDASICQPLTNNPADGGISWVSFAAEDRYHLLYTAAGCPAKSPAVIVHPGGSTSECVRFPTGSGQHILSVGMLDATPDLQAVNGVVAGHSVAGAGMGEAPTNVIILYGNSIFMFGDITPGPALVRDPRYIDFEQARELLRFTWTTGLPIGTSTFRGSSTDGGPLDYVVQYFGTTVANPFAQYDNANGNLVTVMLHRLYMYLIYNKRCRGVATLKSSPTVVIMSVSVSFC